MSKARNRERSQKMAEDMRKRGVKRTTMQCPHTHHTIGIETAFVTHILNCKAGLARRSK